MTRYYQKWMPVDNSPLPQIPWVDPAGVYGWQRPADWLALPAVNVGDKKLVGLVAVHSGGSATIDITGCWGVADLTAEDILIATAKGWSVTTGL